ncbi:MAG: elongation factor G [Planctomycetota bacterium]|nr:elongation factor G [Planctomycetota bacterium]
MAHSSADLRNLALIGHGHSGKTALVDAMAFHTKLVTRQGSSADGSSISNNEPEEKERQQTLMSHLLHFNADKVRINVIDTPGHGDFMAEAIAATGVVEVACLCVNAMSPLTFHARQLWDRAGDQGAARAIVVTHLDHENTDFAATVGELRETLGLSVVPMTYPDGEAANFKAVHSVMKKEGPNADEYREWAEEAEAEVDDELMEHYLENGSFEDAEFEKNLSRAIAAGKVVPVFAVTPNGQVGVAEFVDFVASHFPTPVAFGGRAGGEPGSDEFSTVVEPDADGPFAAQVFKVVADPYVGRLSFLRCVRGKLSVDDQAIEARSGKAQKIAHILDIQGKDHTEIKSVVAGDLFAVSKIEDFGLGDTITSEGNAIEMRQPTFPEPTYMRHVWPKSRGDEQKIGSALEKLCAEDPTFKQHRDKDTGELIVSGMSPLHLEVQFLRMNRRYQVEVEHGAPTIPYRETVTSKADGHHRHKKQSGGRGQFAEVYLRVAPQQDGEGFEFIDSIVGGSIPRQFIPEVEKGARKFLDKGALAGFPVVGCTVEVHDGKFHDVDSDQLSFQLAGERGFLDGYMKAKPVLLEPIMDVEIHVPDRFTGDVAGNLSSARGRLSGMEATDGIQNIKAQVPLATMLDYSTQLRSITAGEGTFAMKFSHYEQVPPNVQQEVVAQRKKVLEEASGS